METTSTVTYMSPDVAIDLNERFNKFMVQRMDAYEEPKCRREGRPFLPIYAASILALTDIPLAEPHEVPFQSSKSANPMRPDI